jgi:hypothetical protein
MFAAAAGVAALLAASQARADYPSTVLSQSPSGYWQLNETTQPAPTVQATNIGSIGSSANGIYSGFPTRNITGPFTGSKAVGLDGVSQNITVPWQAALNPTNFTFEIWANPALVPNFAYVGSSVHIGSPRSGWYMAQDNGSTFGLGNGFVVRFFVQQANAFAATLFATNDLPAGSWYHLVLTGTANTVALYKNGVLAQSVNLTTNWVPNVDSSWTVGSRSDPNFYWPGKVAEVAMYGGALSALQVSNHFYVANNAPGNYQTTIIGDAPTAFYRYTEPIDPPAANSGTLGSAGNGLYIYDAKPGVDGPLSPTFPNMVAGNKAVGFDAGGGVVRLPPLNLNTNTVTITAWVSPTNSQPLGAGIVDCGTEGGLTIDQQFGGYGLGYIWGGNNYGWSPSSDSGLPSLPDSTWSFAALVIRPTAAELYICDANNFANWASVTNSAGVSHAPQAFEVATLVGSVAGFTNRNFNGAVDEVAIFNRSLSAGELYTEYSAAIGGVAPKIFTDIQGPSLPVAVGDPIVLTIDAGGTPPLSYAWRKNGGGVGTTSSGTFTIASAALSDAGTYDVVISGVGSPATSAQVVVSTVNPTAPAITGSSGFFSRTLYPTGSLSLAVTATGGGLKYRWYKNATNAIPNATNSSYTVARVTTADAGSYSVSVTNSLGVTSNGPVAITITNPAAGSYEAFIVASGPEAWWRLDETSGTNIFDGMGRHDGYYTNQNGNSPPVMFGAGGVIASDPDTAVTFSPTYGGFAVIPASSALNPARFTVEAWVKTTNLGGNIAPASSSYGANGWWMQNIGGWWYGDCSAGYFGNNGNVNTAAQIASGQWSLIAIEYDGTRVINSTHYPNVLYVNGQTDGFVWGGTDPNTAGPFIIGGRGVSATTVADRLMDGQVDEVAVYQRLLPQSEVLAHFNGRFGSTTPPFFVGTFLPQTVTAGKTVSYSTTVYGSTPISVQWYKGNTKITGATNTSITLSNLAVTDTSAYTIWATNGAGTASQSVNVTVLAPVSYANVTNGLVLHMKFEGDTSDSSGRGNNGTATGGPGFVAGRIGQAIQLTSLTNGSGTFGSASYVLLGRPADLLFSPSTSFSVSMWIKQVAGDTPGDVPWIGNEVGSANNPGWVLCSSYHAGGWQWDLNDGSLNIDMTGPDNSVNDGNWHHFVLTVDRGNSLAKSYFDGVLSVQSSISGLGTVDNGTNIVMGQDPTFTYPESGTNNIDDLGIWTRALSATEVAKMESAGRLAGRSFDQPGPPVTLTVTKSGANVTITYAAGTLLQSDSLSPGAVWIPVSGASPPSYTAAASASTRFYKVQVQ